MRFLVSFWDAVFGEKLELELPGPDGRLIRRRATRRWLEAMKSRGQARDVTESKVRVHMLDPMASQHYRVEYWTIGTDIPPATVQQGRDPMTGDLYAITVYEAGKPRIQGLTRQLWEVARGQMDAVV